MSVESTREVIQRYLSSEHKGLDTLTEDVTFKMMAALYRQLGLKVVPG